MSYFSHHSISGFLLQKAPLFCGIRTILWLGIVFEAFLYTSPLSHLTFQLLDTTTGIMATPEIHRLYAMTIFGYKKTDMAEEDYHDYISKTHAGHLKALLAKNDIVSYTMVSKIELPRSYRFALPRNLPISSISKLMDFKKQHNTSEVNVPMLEKIYAGRLPTGNISDCDAIIRIVFKDIQDYLRVREDPHFVSVVNPDHLNFADPRRTRFAVGWFEAHITAGKVVS